MIHKLFINFLEQMHHEFNPPWDDENLEQAYYAGWSDAMLTMDRNG